MSLRNMEPRTNSLLDLIHDYDYESFRNFNNKYSKYSNTRDLVEIGTDMGPSTSSTGNGINKEVKRELVIIEITLKGLKIAHNRTQPNLEKLRSRLKLAKSIRTTGNAIAAISSGGLLAAISSSADFGNLTLLAALINFAAIMSNIYANHLETSLHGGQGSLIDTFSKLVRLSAESRDIMKQLEIAYKTSTFDDSVSQLVAKANSLATDLHELENLLWGPNRNTKSAVSTRINTSIQTSTP